MKIVTLFALESGDPADMGDELGAIILFVITLGLLIWQYVSIRRMTQTAEIEALKLCMHSLLSILLVLKRDVI